MSGFSGTAQGGGVGASVETGEIAAGAVTRVKAAANFNQTYSAYAVGTVYSLTETPAAVDFGTTDPAITIAVAGTYRLRGRVNLLYNGATFAASQEVTLKFRRTNNTAADLADGATVVATAIVTTVTATMLVVELPEIFYTTANTDDVLTIFGNVASVPGAGSLDIVEAEITAVRVG